MIRSTVLKMVRGGFLLTDLVPESNQDDALGHVLAKLPDCCSLRQPLKLLRDHLRDADRTPPGTPERLAELMAARTVCDELAYVDRPLSTDVVADAHITIPAALAEEAAEAVGVLWRVSQARDALADYHRRFLERYGPNRFVPLLEVADQAIGLGDIEAEAEAESEADTLPSERWTILAALLNEAIAHGRMEVELDETTVDALDKHRMDMPPPPTAEVYARFWWPPRRTLGPADYRWRSTAVARNKPARPSADSLRCCPTPGSVRPLTARRWLRNSPYVRVHPSLPESLHRAASFRPGYRSAPQPETTIWISAICSWCLTAIG